MLVQILLRNFRLLRSAGKINKPGRISAGLIFFVIAFGKLLIANCFPMSTINNHLIHLACLIGVFLKHFQLWFCFDKCSVFNYLTETHAWICKKNGHIASGLTMWSRLL